jgi:phosphonate ABC transporter permease subunit PhnE
MITVAAPAQVPMRHWRRFTFAQRAMRSVFYVGALIAIVWSLRSIEIIPEFLYDAPQQTVDLFARMWPIDWAWYPKVVHGALVETLHTATLGTILAVAMASLVALMVARNVTRSVVLNSIGRFILVATRSVHAMIWALFFVAVFGPGALAGTMAIAMHSIGFTGKFLSEAIEEAKPGPIEALVAAGAPPLAILLKGYWPQVKPAFLSISVFRWDINVRESAVLGLVGGGGLGMALDTALSNLYWDEVGLVLFVIFGVVMVGEIVTAWARSSRAGASVAPYWPSEPTVDRPDALSRLFRDRHDVMRARCKQAEIGGLKPSKLETFAPLNLCGLFAIRAADLSRGRWAAPGRSDP